MTIFERIPSLDWDMLTRIEEAVKAEIYARRQQSLKKESEAPPTDDIGRALAAIQARAAQAKADEESARADARHLHRLDVQARFRAGGLPSHFSGCGICGRAVLTLRHADACPEGKQYVNLISVD